MSAEVHTFVDPDRVERRQPAEVPDTVVLNPEAHAEGLATFQQVFQATRDAHQAFTAGLSRTLGVLKEAAKRGALYPTATRTIKGVHPGDVPVGLDKFLFHSGASLEGIAGLRAEEAFALALEAVDQERERRALLRVKDHRHASSSRTAAIADEVGQRLTAYRAGRPTVSGSQR